MFGVHLTIRHNRTAAGCENRLALFLCCIFARPKAEKRRAWRVGQPI
jgi:hypothetical protein